MTRDLDAAYPSFNSIGSGLFSLIGNRLLASWDDVPVVSLTNGGVEIFSRNVFTASRCLPVQNFLYNEQVYSSLQG